MARTEMLIGGQWRPASGAGQSEDVTSPYDGSVVGTVPLAGTDDVDAALARRRARRAGPGATRRRTSGCGSCCARPSWPTSGPPRSPGRSAPRTARRSPRRRGEAGRSGELIRLAAFEGTQLYGDTLPLDANRGTGLDKIGFTAPPTLRRRRRHHPVQLPVAAGPAQARARTGRRQRRRAQASPHHPADRAGAGRLLRRRRPARGRAVGAHRPRRRAGRRAGHRPAGPQDLLHRLDRHRRAHHPHGRGEEAVAGAGRLLPGGRAARRRPRAGRERGRRRAATSTPARSASRCSGSSPIPRSTRDFLDALVPKVEAIRTGDPSSPDTDDGHPDHHQPRPSGSSGRISDAVDRRRAAAHRRRARRRRGRADRGRRRRPGLAVQPGRAVRPRRRGQRRRRTGRPPSPRPTAPATASAPASSPPTSPAPSGPCARSTPAASTSTGPRCGGPT